MDSSYLFERHSEHLIKEWSNQLRYFSFYKESCPHVNGGDEFFVTFSFSDVADLVNKLGQTGIQLKPTNYFQPLSDIKSFNDLQQPGNQLLNGRSVFIYIYDGYFRISVSGTLDGNTYEVTTSDFEKCLELEKYFDTLGWQNMIKKF